MSKAIAFGRWAERGCVVLSENWSSCKRPGSSHLEHSVLGFLSAIGAALEAVSELERGEKYR